MKRYAVVAFLLILPLLAACGGDDDEATPTPTTEQARIQLCADLAVLKNDVTALRTASPDNTIATFQRLVDAVRIAKENVQKSAATFEASITGDIESAQKDLDEAMNAVPDTATAAEAQEAIAKQITALEEAESATEQELGCGLISQATATSGATPTGSPGAETPAAETPAAESTPSAEPEATATLEPEPTATLEPEPTATLEPEPTATEEPAPTEAPTNTPEPTAAPEPTATPGPPPTAGTSVYKADWAAGPGEWTLPEGWTIDNGALVANSPDGHAAAAPYQPTTPNYAVEATIAVTGGTFTCDQQVGIFARAVTVNPDTEEAFPVGMIGSFCPERWQVAVVQDATRAPAVAAQGPFDPGTAEHKYRLEVSGATYRLFIDGTFAGEGTDERFGDPGKAGLYFAGGVQVRVTSFEVFEF